MTLKIPTPKTVTSAGVTYTICPEDEYAYSGTECPMCKDRKFGWFYDQLAEYEDALFNPYIAAIASLHSTR